MDHTAKAGKSPVERHWGETNHLFLESAFPHIHEQFFSDGCRRGTRSRVLLGFARNRRQSE